MSAVCAGLLCYPDKSAHFLARPVNYIRFSYTRSCSQSINRLQDDMINLWTICFTIPSSTFDQATDTIAINSWQPGLSNILTLRHLYGQHAIRMDVIFSHVLIWKKKTRINSREFWKLRATNSYWLVCCHCTTGLSSRRRTQSAQTYRDNTVMYYSVMLSHFSPPPPRKNKSGGTNPLNQSRQSDYEGLQWKFPLDWLIL